MVSKYYNYLVNTNEEEIIYIVGKADINSFVA
jgi:hypothetical protein